MDTVPLPGFAMNLAARGVYVGINTINSSVPSEVQSRVDLVLELVRAGHADQILLSHDVCTGSHQRAFGGNGFTFVLGGFRQQLLDAGLAAEQLDRMVTANPARFLSGVDL
jgi:phosphotriesterase-related protein